MNRGHHKLRLSLLVLLMQEFEPGALLIIDTELFPQLRPPQFTDVPGGSGHPPTSSTPPSASG
jgi:hypothetical protein